MKRCDCGACNPEALAMAEGHDRHMEEQAKLRPANYDELSPSKQWAIDKELGILDWDGGK